MIIWQAGNLVSKRSKLLLAVVFAVAPVAALAQQAASPPAKPSATPQMQAPATKVNSTEVMEFAQLFVAVHKIRVDYGPKIQAAKDNKTRTALEQEGKQKIEQAIKKSPMTIQRYEQIAHAAAKDPQLKKRLVMTIKKLESK